MIEYDRDGNVNTAEFWDAAWRRNPEDGANKDGVRREVLVRLETLPSARVWEYGFGGLHLARALGKDRWHGVDHSKVAVAAAKAEGFSAEVGRCADSPGFTKSYLVALEVLEHLDADEMVAFLKASQRAPHAFFSVPHRMRDRDFAQHMRAWEGPEDLDQFLRQWWPHVEVTAVDAYLLAHCRKSPAARDPDLTIGCSTLLDFHGVQWTLAAMNTIHGYGRFDGRVELVVVDNHPAPTGSAEAGEVSDMRAIVEGEGARYIRWAEKQGTYPGKNRLVVESRSPWVLTFDSHVMLSPGTVETVLDYIDRNPDSSDFHHFPNIGHRTRGVAAMDYRQMDMIYRKPEWKGAKAPSGYYGWTGKMNEPGEPYPVAAMITSCYLVRKDAWLSAKGYDPILGNYGGWEGPIQMKWWLMGRRVVSMRHRDPEIMKRHGPLHHWHLFNNFKRMRNETGRIHTGQTKQRNFMASSAVIGGEPFARWLASRWGLPWDAPHIQEGFKAGMELRPWMVSQLARPEWEDIFEFFAWMKAQKIPGHLTEW